MHSSFRRKLLFSLVLLFVVIGGGVSFYAQGYRIDPNNFSVQKIGGIYVRSFPSSATIFLDDEPVKKTRHLFSRNFWFLQNGTLINDLFPKKYVITLVAEGFRDWKQTVEVKPSLVSELKYSVLVPKSETLIDKGTKNFWVIGGNIIAQNASSSLYSAGKAIPGAVVLDTNEASGRILTSDGERNFYIYDFDTNQSVKITSLALNASIPKTAKKIFLDQSDDRILYQSQRELYIANTSSWTAKEIGKIPATSTLSEISPVATSRTYLAWTIYDLGKDASRLVSYNKDTGNRNEYLLPFKGKTVQIEWQGERLGLIQSDGSFYFGSPLTSEGMTKIASDAVEFRFSDKNERVAVREKKALEVFPLNTQDENEYSRLNLPDSGNIRSMYWYFDNRHLFLSYPDKTMFLDTKDPQLEHFEQVGTSDAKYISQINELYFIRNASLYAIIFPQ